MNDTLTAPLTKEEYLDARREVKVLLKASSVEESLGPITERQALLLEAYAVHEAYAEDAYTQTQLNVPSTNLCKDIDKPVARWNDVVNCSPGISCAMRSVCWAIAHSKRIHVFTPHASIRPKLIRAPVRGAAVFDVIGSMIGDIGSYEIPAWYYDLRMFMTAYAARHRSNTWVTANPERLRKHFASNVWTNAFDRMKHIVVAVSVHTQRDADTKIRELLKLPIPRKQIWVTPPLEALNLRPWLSSEIESVEYSSSCGPWHDKISAVRREWLSSVVNQCDGAGVKAVFKALGAWLEVDAVHTVANRPVFTIGDYDMAVLTAPEFENDTHARLSIGDQCLRIRPGHIKVRDGRTFVGLASDVRPIVRDMLAKGML